MSEQADPAAILRRTLEQLSVDAGRLKELAEEHDLDAVWGIALRVAGAAALLRNLASLPVAPREDNFLHREVTKALGPYAEGRPLWEAVDALRLAYEECKTQLAAQGDTPSPNPSALFATVYNAAVEAGTVLNDDVVTAITEAVTRKK